MKITKTKTRHISMDPRVDVSISVTLKSHKDRCGMECISLQVTTYYQIKPITSMNFWGRLGARLVYPVLFGQCAHALQFQLWSSGSESRDRMVSERNPDKKCGNKVLPRNRRVKSYLLNPNESPLVSCIARGYDLNGCSA